MSGVSRWNAAEESHAAWLWKHRWDDLAWYNVTRTLDWSPEHRALMKEQQAAFDRERAAKNEPSAVPA